MFPLKDSSKPVRSQRFRRNANQNHWEAHVLIEIAFEADRERMISVEHRSNQLGHQSFRLKIYQNDWGTNVFIEIPTNAIGNPLFPSRTKSKPLENQCCH